MVLFLVFCIVGVTLLVMPETFGDLAVASIEHPVWGVGLLAIVGLILVWINKR